MSLSSLSPRALSPSAADYALSGARGTASVRQLGDADLMDVLTLQEITRAALPEGMKTFMLPQPPSYFENLLTQRTGLMVGIHAEGKLIAQMAAMGTMPLRDALAQNVITKNKVPFHHAALTDPVIVFKSVAVHPDWRGNEHSRHMLSFAFETPLVKSASHVFAQISANNRRSWDVFLRMGFGVVAAGHDPADGGPRFVLQKPLFGFDYEPEPVAEEVDPKEDFAAIVNLTEREALIGNYELGADGRLSFMRNAEADVDLNLMPTLARVKA